MASQHSLIRILVVEDDPDDLLLLAEELKSHPLAWIETIIVGDQELMDFVTKSGRFTDYSAPLPALILLNPFAQEYDIRSAITLLSANGFKQVPIVGMVAAEYEEDYLKEKNLDLAGYVIKPVMLEQLLQFID